jgi:hypothetical protein
VNPLSQVSLPKPRFSGTSLCRPAFQFQQAASARHGPKGFRGLTIETRGTESHDGSTYIPQTWATRQASYADSAVSYHCRLSCVEALQSALEMDRALDLDREAFVGRAICEFIEELKT